MGVAFESREDLHLMIKEVDEIIEAYLVMFTLSSGNDDKLYCKKRDCRHYMEWKFCSYRPDMPIIQIETNLYNPKLSIIVNKRCIKNEHEGLERLFYKHKIEVERSQFEYDIGVNSSKEVGLVLAIFQDYLLL